MREAIAGFCSNYFYNGHCCKQLRIFLNTGVHISFIDTAGSGYNEVHGSDGISLQNEGELLIVQKLLETESPDPLKLLLSPLMPGKWQQQKMCCQSKCASVPSTVSRDRKKKIIILITGTQQ